jgi:hypothetical protein
MSEGSKSLWRNSNLWRPPQFGIFHPAEWVPFLTWLAPAALGVLLLICQRTVLGISPSSPEHLAQFGVLNGYLSWTLLWSPLWGFPAIAVSLALRWVLLITGRFGLASAIIGGAASGIAVPIMLGRNFILAGPLYGALTLWMQQAIYKFQYPETFGE